MSSFAAFASYDAWLASPYAEGAPGDVEDAYDSYCDNYWATLRSEFDDGGHDYVGDWDAYVAATDVPNDMLDFGEFYEGWVESQFDAAVESYYATHHPDAKI